MAEKELSATKRALLERWLDGAVKDGTPHIPKRPPGSEIPLSFPQQRRLFLDLLERGTAVNNLSLFLLLKGELDLDAWARSAKQILARHEALRTRFSFAGGIPTPEVVDAPTLQMPVVDLKAGEDHQAAARRQAEQEALRPFDLTKAPLFRVRLYRKDRRTHYFLLIAHHCIADGWSLGVFLRELMAHYQANRSDSPPQVQPLPIQYADYAHWQQGAEQQEAWQPAATYWHKQLAGDPPVLELPTDRPRGTRQTFNGGTHRFVIDRVLTAGLERLARREGATLFMTLLAGYVAMLHRFSGQDEILVGAPIANRNMPEIQHLIGVFINTLVLRSDLSGDPAFRELLRRVRATCLQAYAHQDYPFERLVEDLKPRRGLTRTPLFQVVFILQNAPMPDMALEGLSAEVIEIDRGVSQFDLTLMVTKREGQGHATVEYNADLFEAATIKRMFRFYQDLLETVSDRPDTRLSTLPLLTPPAWQRVVVDLNRTSSAVPNDRCVHHLIAEQTQRTPEAPALVMDQRQMTYGELDRRATALAGFLQSQGVGPKVRVGVFMRRSLHIAEVLLGILKAGGAFIPIHVASPPERVQFILKETEAPLLLTNTDPGPLEGYAGGVVSWPDERILEGYASTVPADRARPDDLAYIIYTSGSTGLPKGVLVKHASLLNFLWSMRARPGFDRRSVVLALASISFDISTLEWFLPLMVGGRVVVAPERLPTDPSGIIEAVERHHINLLQATPATWQILLDTGWSGSRSLRALCGGDVLTRTMADQLLERVGQLWNVYGPTETTVWATCGQVRPGAGPITIGQPIGNVQVYILDRYLQPVPVGVVGELHIAGAGLGPGYLNRPELTEAQFIPHPFRDEPDARMYRTGDRARYLPGYRIQVLGRSDDQVKVQGYRVELGEIAAVLDQHPLVHESKVITRDEGSGDRRLVAYYTSADGQRPAKGALRKFLADKLPAYMVPAFIVAIPAFPLTPNGKIDRRALPPPDAAAPATGYVPPRTEDERLMADIWQHVLGLPQVGVNDNFFELGGASMQSIQVVARANMFGYPIRVEDLFEHQTVAELVEHLRPGSG